MTVTPAVHLDTRTRWIPPEGEMFPEEFEWPFQECHLHVTEAKYEKKGTSKIWVCQGIRNLLLII